MKQYRPLRPIHGLSFDLDDTLWDNTGVVPAAEAVMHAWLAQRAPALAARYSVDALRELYPEAVAADPVNAYDMAALRRWCLATALTRVGADPALAEPAFQVFQAARHRVPLPPEVPALLARLGQRYPLVAVTNGTIDLDAVGLARHFVARIAPPDAGAAKPHALPFLAGCEALGLAPDEVLHIGDDLRLDVAGALNAGLMAAWFNPSRLGLNGATEPHLELSLLSELTQLP